VPVRLETLSDAELVARCRTGDDAAWAMLVERFSRYVWAVAVRGYGLAERDAEDVFQEVFFRTWQHLPRLRSDEAIRPWIGQLTRRLCVDKHRGARREQPVDVLPETAERDAELERLAEALTVRDALGRLSESCQVILERFFIRDEPYETIGRALEIPGGTIASRISRCLGRLREALAGAEPAVKR
jgi:RNA polymerase sigma factor (sigma-70 family)